MSSIRRACLEFSVYSQKDWLLVYIMAKNVFGKIAEQLIELENAQCAEESYGKEEEETGELDRNMVVYRGEL